MINCVELLGVKILAVDINDALEVVIGHIRKRNGDYFCFTNIHLVMECNKNPMFKKAFNEASGNFPDGMGVAWALKLLGYRFKGRVRGADFMLKLCAYAAKNNLRILLYGNTHDVLASLKNKLENLYKNINIIGMISPPFREQTAEEDTIIVKSINDANPDIIFVSLGAPRQEKWMAKHKERISAIQIGVGAAFGFIAGSIKQSPPWMQNIGLEWFFRLPQEPKKVILRMLLVPAFLWGVTKQFVRSHYFQKNETL